MTGYMVNDGYYLAPSASMTTSIEDRLHRVSFFDRSCSSPYLP